MPKYKIVKIYIVDAPNRIAARSRFTTAQVNNKEDEFLEHISIKPVEEHSNGWADTLKKQLTGS